MSARWTPEQYAEFQAKRINSGQPSTAKKRKPPAVRLEPTEADIQKAIVDGLRAHRYVVIVTSRHRRACPQCGTYDHRGDGTDKGLPDLCVWIPSVGYWLLADVKDATGKPTTEQQEHLDAGRMLIWRSFDQALADVLERDKGET